MPDRVQIVAIIGSLTLLAIILEAVRKRRLREQYALAWLVTGAVLLLLAAWRELLHWLSALMGIYYPPSALLLIGIGLVVLILLSFLVIVSDLSAKITRLSQKVAILEWEIDPSQRLPEESNMDHVAGPPFVEAQLGVASSAPNASDASPSAAAGGAEAKRVGG